MSLLFHHGKDLAVALAAEKFRIFYSLLEELFARIRVHLAAARLVHSAQTALDVVGHSLLATTAAGGCCRTPQATVAIASNGQAAGLAPAIVEPILALMQRATRSANPRPSLNPAAARWKSAWSGKPGRTNSISA